MVLLRCVGWSRDDILTFSDFGPNLLRARKPNCMVGRQARTVVISTGARQIIASACQVGERKLLQHLGGNRTHLQPSRHSRLNNGPVGQEHDKEHLSQRSLDRVRKANKPIRERSCPKFLRFQCSNLYVIKGGHKVGSNLCGFLFGYGIRRILFTGLKDVFQRAAVLGRASVSCFVTADLDSWKQSRSRSLFHPAAANTRNRSAP